MRKDKIKLNWPCYPGTASSPLRLLKSPNRGGVGILKLWLRAKALRGGSREGRMCLEADGGTALRLLEKLALSCPSSGMTGGGERRRDAALTMGEYERGVGVGENEDT